MQLSYTPYQEYNNIILLTLHLANEIKQTQWIMKVLEINILAHIMFAQETNEQIKWNVSRSLSFTQKLTCAGNDYSYMPSAKIWQITLPTMSLSHCRQ